MTVRKAVAADAGVIAAAEREYMDCPWTEAQVSDEIADERVTFLVAENGGALIGYVSAKTTLDECEFGNIAVAENYRRRGAASALMTELFRAVASAGARKVFLEVRSDNIAAVSLYERFGFEVLRVRSGYYNGKDATVMIKNL